MNWKKMKINRNKLSDNSRWKCALTHQQKATQDGNTLWHHCDWHTDEPEMEFHKQLNINTSIATATSAATSKIEPQNKINTEYLLGSIRCY